MKKLRTSLSFIMFIAFTASFLGCDLGSIVENDTENVVADNTQEVVENSSQEVVENGAQEVAENDAQEIITNETVEALHIVKFWEYSSLKYIRKYRTEPPSWAPLLSPDGESYISESVKDICDFIELTHEREDGVEFYQRAFYIKVFTRHKTIHIWKGHGSRCDVHKPFQKECDDISLLDDGNTLSCKIGDATTTWDLEKL